MIDLLAPVIAITIFGLPAVLRFIHWITDSP